MQCGSRAPSLDPRAAAAPHERDEPTDRQRRDLPPTITPDPSLPRVCASRKFTTNADFMYADDSSGAFDD